MKNGYCAGIIILMVATAPACAAQARSSLASAFGALPRVRQMTLSSNGHELAWLQPRRHGTTVFAYDIGTHSTRREFQLGRKFVVTWMDWENKNTLLIRTRNKVRLPAGGSRTHSVLASVYYSFSLNIATGKFRPLLQNVMNEMLYRNGYLVSANILDWNIPARPNTVIMSVNTYSPSGAASGLDTLIRRRGGYNNLVNTVFAVNARTGQSKPIAFGNARTTQWFVNNDGTPVARSEWRSPVYRVYAKQAGTWRIIYQHTEPTHPYAGAMLDPTAHVILTFLPGNSGGGHLWEIPLNGGPPKRVLPGVKQRVKAFQLSNYASRLEYVSVGGARAHRIWFDKAAKMAYESIAHAFPGHAFEIDGYSRNHREVLVRAEDADEPATYYLVNFATRSAAIVGKSYPQLTHLKLRKARALDYRTLSGRSIHAQLFLPPHGGKDLPLIVLVPGGPPETSLHQFDWFAQYLALNGYAVLRPYLSWTSLATPGGDLRWHGASQRYAIDGAHLLIRQGMIDPHRVCIVGVGYGGYAALAGAAFSPRTYACAVSINGISDLRSLMADTIREYGNVPADHADLVAWRTLFGSPSDPKVGRESPLYAAKAVVAPVLLICDRNDMVVPARQSARMRRALRRLGKPVSFLQLSRGGHFLTSAAARTRVLKATGAFLAKYLQR